MNRSKIEFKPTVAWGINMTISYIDKNRKRVTWGPKTCVCICLGESAAFRVTQNGVTGNILEVDENTINWVTQRKAQAIL